MFLRLLCFAGTKWARKVSPIAGQDLSLIPETNISKCAYTGTAVLRNVSWVETRSGINYS